MTWKSGKSSKGSSDAASGSGLGFLRWPRLWLTLSHLGDHQLPWGRGWMGTPTPVPMEFRVFVLGTYSVRIL